MNRVVLLPGQLVISDKDEEVWTLLGSCVSIIFYNPQRRVSGVSHAQLPHESMESACKDRCPKPCGRDEKQRFRYVTCSFRYMLEQFNKLGIHNKEIEVSIFGGGNMLNLKKPIDRIGERNVIMAKELISKNNLVIKREDTGGDVSRTIIHHSTSGITELRISQQTNRMKQPGNVLNIPPER